MDSHEVGAAGERPLHHELGEGSDHGGEDVTSAEHGLADGHEVGDGMVAIADELLSGISIRSGRTGSIGGGQTSCRLFAISACRTGRVRALTFWIDTGGGHTVASAWLSLTPRASRRWASSPNCEVTSLSSYDSPLA